MPARNELDDQHQCKAVFQRSAYAIAIMVLRVSSIRSPSHMLRPLYFRSVTDVEETDAPNIQQKKTTTALYSTLPIHGFR